MGTRKFGCRQLPVYGFNCLFARQRFVQRQIVGNAKNREKIDFAGKINARYLFLFKKGFFKVPYKYEQVDFWNIGIHKRRTNPVSRIHWEITLERPDDGNA